MTFSEFDVVCHCRRSAEQFRRVALHAPAGPLAPGRPPGPGQAAPRHGPPAGEGECLYQSILWCSINTSVLDTAQSHKEALSTVDRLALSVSDQCACVCLTLILGPVGQ